MACTRTISNRHPPHCYRPPQLLRVVSGEPACSCRDKPGMCWSSCSITSLSDAWLGRTWELCMLVTPLVLEVCSDALDASGEETSEYMSSVVVGG